MSKLVERMRKMREFVHEIDGYRLTLIRPTIEQMVDHKRVGFAHLDLAKQYVIGWDVKDCDIVSGGTTEVAEFDRDGWIEYLADKPAWWHPLGKVVLDNFNDYAESKEVEAKN